MGKFDFNDMDPDWIEPEFDEPVFPAPSVEDLGNEFTNEPDPVLFDDMGMPEGENISGTDKKMMEEPHKQLQETEEIPPEPSPSSVNLSGMDGREEKSSPEIDYGEENPVDTDGILNHKSPTIFPEEPMLEQKKANKMPENVKEMIIQGTAFLILLATGMLTAMFFSYNDKKTDSLAGSPTVSATESQQPAENPSMLETKKWEPGIISNNIPTEHEEITTEAVTTEQPSTKEARRITTEADTMTSAVPSDARFKDTAELTLYIQNATSVVYRKEKEIVQSYIDGQTDLDMFLSTMNTYSVALNELSHLLVVNRNCYGDDKSTYRLLEKNISAGMIYADNSVALANAGTPLSEFKEKLGE